MAKTRYNLICFDSFDEYFEVYVLDSNNPPSFPAILSDEIPLENLIGEFQREHSIELLTISLSPVFKTGPEHSPLLYFGGFIDPITKNSITAEGSWVHPRRIRVLDLPGADIQAFDHAQSWVMEHDYAAEFLSTNLRKLR